MMKKLFVVLVVLVLLLPSEVYLSDVIGKKAALPFCQLDFLLDNQRLNQLLVTGWGCLHGAILDTGSPQVVKGRNGYLFFTPALDSVLGARRMEQHELDALADRLAGISERLKRQGTRFVLLIAPDKSGVYPQYLPWYISPAASYNTDRSQLISLLKQRDVLAPDLQAMLSAQETKTYLKTDTHWNAYGANLAFQTLMKSAGFTDSYGFLPADFNLPKPAPGDLVPLFLPGIEDPQTDFLPPLHRSYRTAAPMRSLDDMTIRTMSDAAGPSIYVARDSFGKALFPYLAKAASSMMFTRDYTGFEERAAGYDLAVLLLAERSLGSLMAFLAPVD
ncbi:MAG: hypothetical protein GXZ04_07370 [Clostridiales bacterium]|nr:hypothetical protein [Clostridiales bacterium]